MRAGGKNYDMGLLKENVLKNRAEKIQTFSNFFYNKKYVY